jgi:hypothetical protein
MQLEVSLSAYVALQSNGDSTDVKEAPSNTSMMQGEESETTRQEAAHTGEFEVADPNLDLATGWLLK